MNKADVRGPFPSRRRFLRSSAGLAALAASIGSGRGELEADESESGADARPQQAALTIREVDAYPRLHQSAVRRALRPTYVLVG